MSAFTFGRPRLPRLTRTPVVARDGGDRYAARELRTHQSDASCASDAFASLGTGNAITHEHGSTSALEP